MPHSNEAYNLAKRIVDSLKEAKLLIPPSDFEENYARGLIQVMMEESELVKKKIIEKPNPSKEKIWELER